MPIAVQNAGERRATQQRLEPFSGELDARPGARSVGQSRRARRSWSRAPPSAKATLFPDCAAARSTTIRPPRPAMSSGSRCHAIRPPRVAASRPGRDSERPIRPCAVGFALGRGAFFDGRRVSAIAPSRLRFWPGTGAPDPRLVSGVLSALSCRYDRPITVFSAQSARPSTRNRPSRALMVV